MRVVPLKHVHLELLFLFQKFDVVPYHSFQYIYVEYNIDPIEKNKIKFL